MGAMGMAMIPATFAYDSAHFNTSTNFSSSTGTIRASLSVTSRTTRKTNAATKIKKATPSASCSHLTGFALANCMRNGGTALSARRIRAMVTKAISNRGISIRTGTGWNVQSNSSSSVSGSGSVRGFHDSFDWMSPSVHDALNGSESLNLRWQKPVTSDHRADTAHDAWEACKDRLPRTRTACMNRYMQDHSSASDSSASNAGTQNMQGTELNPGGARS